ncbi:hypothetical protein CI1B_31550 [Bradyrhizobium ivorense]|uniref:Uncharacterized protein n=1 Tax=Bradyrhizobium ivorense TaxID=2511166 RepID=A0A508T8H8_9BRAD|nr:hypothetical protein CI1B_31550 [Bradyrhizobium ivorense]
MQRVLCVKELLRHRVSLVASLLFAPSICSRPTCEPLRDRALMLGRYLLRFLLHAAYRSRPRRRGGAQDRPRAGDANSQEGEERRKMTPLSPSPASRASTVTLRSRKPAPASGSAYPSSPRSGRSVPIVCSCSALTCSEASFAPDLGFARSNLTYADAATGWFASPAEPLAQPDFLKSASRARRPNQPSDVLGEYASGIESAGQSKWPTLRRFLDCQRVAGEPGGSN